MAKPTRLPLFATLVYTLVGVGWIVTGFYLSRALYGQHDASTFEMLNGLAFVVITASLLFIALRHLNPGASDAEATSVAIAKQFRESIRSDENSLRWLPRQLMIFVAVLLCFLLLGLAWMRENALKSGETASRAVQFAIAAQISSSLRLVENTLADIAQDLASAKLSDADTRSVVALHHATPVARTLAMVNAQGLMVYNSDGRTSTEDFSGREYFRHHRDHPQSGLHISNPHRGMFTNNWIITASKAVRGPGGEFRGVVLAILDLELFGKYWQVPGFDQNESITLFRSDGSLLLRSPHRDDAPVQLNRRALKWLDLLPSQPAGVYRAHSVVDDLDKVFAYGRVPQYPEFMLVFGIPEHQILRE